MVDVTHNPDITLPGVSDVALVALRRLSPDEEIEEVIPSNRGDVCPMRPLQTGKSPIKEPLRSTNL